MTDTGASPVELPMFPLGSVTVPGGLLTLQVFEPRYLALVRDCTESGQGFGTVLIERGSEVGGGDVRCDVGTFVTIVEATPIPGDRWALFGLGTGRFRVTRWLVDDPYPRALVVSLPEDPVDASAAELLGAATRVVRAWLGRARDLGVSRVDPGIELPEDPALASHMLSVLSPLGPLDRQYLLASPGPTQRLTALVELMDGQLDLLEALRPPDRP